MKKLFLPIIAILLFAEVNTMINWHQDVKQLHQEIQQLNIEIQQVRYNVSKIEKNYEYRDTTDTSTMAILDETISD